MIIKLSRQDMAMLTHIVFESDITDAMLIWNQASVMVQCVSLGIIISHDTQKYSDFEMQMLRQRYKTCCQTLNNNPNIHETVEYFDKALLLFKRESQAIVNRVYSKPEFEAKPIGIN